MRVLACRGSRQRPCCCMAEGRDPSRIILDVGALLQGTDCYNELDGNARGWEEMENVRGSGDTVRARWSAQIGKAGGGGFLVIRLTCSSPPTVGAGGELTGAAASRSRVGVSAGSQVRVNGQSQG